MSRPSVTTAGILIGAGLGGFVDGIVLHQILQWHNMLSSRVPPLDLVHMKYNMVWDGLFHALTWIMTATGLALLWRAGAAPADERPWSSRRFGGALLFGWGTFNVVEGVIDHTLLRVHHVHPGLHEQAWDLGFLGFGVVLALIGSWLTGALVRGGASAVVRRPD
ncbi:MAG: hypothetical protein JWN44_4680 [Myxococcales bacterium]|nr:hypothetical protein [Myxococcales bacterium]